MSESNIFILVYIALWGITFFYYWKKKKFFGAGNLIIASYLFYAILAFFLYNHESSVEYDKLTLFPFIYLYVLLLIFLQPVLRYDEKCKIQLPSESIIKPFIYLYALSAIGVTPYVFSHIQEGLATIALTSSGGDELYYASHLGIDEEKSWSIYNVFKIVFNFFSDFGVLLFFVYAAMPNRKKSLMIMMLFAIFIKLAEALASGYRTELVMHALSFITAYFLFRNHFSSQTNKSLKMVLIGFVVFASFFTIAINSSRYSGKSYESSFQLLNYAGQASLQFNSYGLDAGGIRNGDRTCNWFKRKLGFEDVPKDIDSTRNKYLYMKLNDSRFSTFVGDFTLDFGPFATAILLPLFSLLFSLATKKRNGIIAFHQLIIILFVMTVCVQGGMYLFYYSFDKNIRIIYILLLYLFFKWDYDYHVKQSKIKICV